jgi:hypothetical protein
MAFRYPIDEDWERFLASPNDIGAAGEDAFLGTIADLLQRIELAKKGRIDVSLPDMKQQVRALLDGDLVGQHYLRVLELDLQALQEAMFESDSDDALWREVANKNTRPWRTLRRLVLRDHDNRGFGDQPYLEMEAFFGEEPERNG